MGTLTPTYFVLYPNLIGTLNVILGNRRQDTSTTK